MQRCLKKPLNEAQSNIAHDDNEFIHFIHNWIYFHHKNWNIQQQNHRWKLWQGLSCKLILLCFVGLGLFRLKLLHVLNSNQKHIVMLECRWKIYDPHFNCYKKSFHTHHNSTEKKACVRQLWIELFLLQINGLHFKD